MTASDVLYDIRAELRAIHALLAALNATMRVPLPAVPYEQLAAVMGRAALPTRSQDGFPTMHEARTVMQDFLQTPYPQTMGATVAAGVMAGAEGQPDLDTALTMGMEAPAPPVPPDRKGPPSLYPRPDLTPGVVFPNITADDVSVPGYAKRVRAVSQETKNAVFTRYGMDPAKHVTTEVDHFCSLCLAGTNDLENLWPEPAVTPDAPGQVGFHEKDQLEMYLYHEVCQKTITLQRAQDLIRGDWYAAWLAIPRDHPAMMLSYADAPEQP